MTFLFGVNVVLEGLFLIRIADSPQLHISGNFGTKQNKTKTSLIIYRVWRVHGTPGTTQGDCRKREWERKRGAGFYFYWGGELKQGSLHSRERHVAKI